MKEVRSTVWDHNGVSYEIKTFEIPQGYVGKAFKDGKPLKGEGTAAIGIYMQYLLGEIAEDAFFADLEQAVQRGIAAGLLK